MNFTNDKELMVRQGLLSPFSASDALYSPISEESIMTHRVFPGLSGIVPCGSESVAGLITDKLPQCDQLFGALMLTKRADASGEARECWLVQIQSKICAWQFMTADETLAELAGEAVLFEWNPGALEAGYTMHDDMISRLAPSDYPWLIGSRLEKEALSRYLLSSGASSIAHALQGADLMSSALQANGTVLDLKEGPCLRMRSYPITWYSV
jgi:hypothetical protein